MCVIAYADERRRAARAPPGPYLHTGHRRGRDTEIRMPRRAVRQPLNFEDTSQKCVRLYRPCCTGLHWALLGPRPIWETGKVLSSLHLILGISAVSVLSNYPRFIHKLSTTFPHSNLVRAAGGIIYMYMGDDSEADEGPAELFGVHRLRLAPGTKSGYMGWRSRFSCCVQ